RRGVDTNLKPRLQRMPARLRGTTGWIMDSAAVARLRLRVLIFYNTNVLNQHLTVAAPHAIAAAVDKELLVVEKLPPPRLVDVKLNVDVYPREVKAVTKGVYTIENRSERPLSEVHIRWPRRLEMQALEIDGAALEKEYVEFR